MTYKRRYIIRYTADEYSAGSWSIYDREAGFIIEGGYTQTGARQAAHYWNYRHDPKGYPKRNQKRPA